MVITGGAFLNVTREEVELFCIDHLVMVDILATEEALSFDFQTVTTPGPGGKVTGLEAVMQVSHNASSYRFIDFDVLCCEKTLFWKSQILF